MLQFILLVPVLASTLESHSKAPASLAPEVAPELKRNAFAETYHKKEAPNFLAPFAPEVAPEPKRNAFAETYHKKEAPSLKLFNAPASLAPEVAPEPKRNAFAETYHTREPASGSGRLSLVRSETRRMDMFKWCLLLFGAVGVASYSFRALRQRQVRQNVLSLRFDRKPVRRQPANDLTILERLTQESKVVVKFRPKTFVVLSGEDRSEILVGKLDLKRDRREKGCLLAQCLGVLCGGISTAFSSVFQLFGLCSAANVLRSGRWLVGAGPKTEKSPPAFSFDHEDLHDDTIIVRDLERKGWNPLGSLEMDTCSSSARVLPYLPTAAARVPNMQLHIDGSYAGGKDSFLRVMRMGKTVAFLTKGIVTKGLAPEAELALTDTFVDFGEVVNGEEKMLLLAAALYMDI